MENKVKDVDTYISMQSENIRVLLEKLRFAIQSAAPKAEEIISYQMPAYKYYGMLVYFAAHKKHIGFYAVPTGIAAFKKELSVYKTTKGTVQFPLDKPIPIALIKKIVKFRAKENMDKAKAKK
jgi:uncharacterized protein YdhG (YjbR/CyaY superfamily)